MRTLASICTCGLTAVVLSGAAHAGAAHDAIRAQPSESQRQLFAAVIQSSGNACPQVSRLFYKGDDEKGDYWAARCEDGDFLVFMKGGGDMTTRVLSCDVSEAMGVDCWVSF